MSGSTVAELRLKTQDQKIEENLARLTKSQLKQYQTLPIGTRGQSFISGSGINSSLFER